MDCVLRVWQIPSPPKTENCSGGEMVIRLSDSRDLGDLVYPISLRDREN